jgi:septum formation protein
VAAEQDSQTFDDQIARPLDLAGPPRVEAADAEDALVARHARVPRQRGPDRHLPGERDLRGRERLPREQRVQRAGRARARRHEFSRPGHLPSVASSVLRVILASASPRRAELLRAAGIPFEAVPAEIDERPRGGEAPEPYVERIAREKARAVASRRPETAVLGADTTVVVDGLILGKPSDDEDARRMLLKLSGRTHDVLTGVAVIAGGRLTSAVETTRVRFARMTEADIDWYLASGEPRGKAGAYAIQGLASRFVEWIEGSYSNVVGLPVALVWRLLRGLGP